LMLFVTVERPLTPRTSATTPNATSTTAATTPPISRNLRMSNSLPVAVGHCPCRPVHRVSAAVGSAASGRDRKTGSVASRSLISERTDVAGRRLSQDRRMTSSETHRPLCTIELIAEGTATRCPGGECAFWETECILSRMESELGDRPEVAGLLLEI